MSEPNTFLKNVVFWDIKTSSYLRGYTLRLHYRVQPVNAMLDLRFSCRWLWRMPTSGMSRRVALLRIDVSEKVIPSIISVSILSEVGTPLEARRFLSPWWWGRYLHPKRRFLEESHIVLSQKTAFFIVSKAIPGTGRGGLQGCKMLRITQCLDIRLIGGGKVVSPTHRPLLYSRESLFLCFRYLCRMNRLGLCPVKQVSVNSSYCIVHKSYVSPTLLCWSYLTYRKL
jgi:hypothetical protein